MAGSRLERKKKQYVVDFVFLKRQRATDAVLRRTLVEQLNPYCRLDSYGRSKVTEAGGNRGQLSGASSQWIKVNGGFMKDVLLVLLLILT